MERGLYDEPFPVEAEGDLLYSTDGSTPSLTWPGSLEVEGTTTLRLQDPAEDLVVTHTYLFIEDILPTLDAGVVDDAEYGPAIERTLRELPTIVLTHSSALSLTEQEAAFEWIDGVEDTQIDCGLRIVGGHSIYYEKNSFRLNFRSEYGSSRLRLDLYQDFATGVPPADDFDALTLRSGSHDSVFYLGARGQYLRNRWMDESQLEMGHIAPHGRYAHLYTNGAYHGLYHVRERFSAAMLAEYLGGDEDDYEAVNSGTVIDGSGEAWAQALANGYDFEAIGQWVNLENFLDYMILNFYAGNAWDWSAWHNWMAAGHSQTGGYLFHSSDSDICLVYDHTIDILSNPGPGNLFSTLMSQGDEDFLVLLSDRLHSHLVAEDGILLPDAAAERYSRLAVQIEDAVVAESARWGAGWWTRDDYWVIERDALLSDYFPQRTDSLLDQVRTAGWLRLPAPVFTITGDHVLVEPVDEAELWVTLDGSDPRLSDDALGPDVFEATVEYTTLVSGRLYDGSWGPIETRLVEVDTAPPVLLNEWNTVEVDEWLEGGDSSLGELEGNGGDWLELLVVQDLDMRGWRLELEDRSGTLSPIELDHAVLADVRAGTLITIAEGLPEDLSYAPEVGDWRFHVQDEELDVSHREWTLTAWDDQGRVRLGPVGEDITLDGLGSDEVGLYADGEHITARASSYGAPNVWEGGSQDLSALRGEEGRVGPEREVSERVPPEPVGCAGGLLPVLLLLACAGETARRDSAPACFEDEDGDGYGSGVPTACPTGVPNELDCDDQDARIHPSAYEVCNGVDDDCDELVDDDDEVVDGLPFYADGDGDGYGGEEILTLCSAEAGGALSPEDCDDDDPTVHPGAEEFCDGVDRDCDGEAGDKPGATASCAAESCLALLTAEPDLPDGAWWIALESEPTELYCDMTGGGWTLGFLRSSAATGSHGGFGGSDDNADQLELAPAEASSSSGGRRGWIDLNALAWTELQVTAYLSGAESYRSETILREDLRIDFGEDGYLLYGDPYYWCGGAASYTDSGVGAVNNPEGAYADCKGHGSLGSGWDFSETDYGNTGLTLCGSDGSNFMAGTWGGSWTYYGTAGAAQALWVR